MKKVIPNLFHHIDIVVERLLGRFSCMLHDYFLKVCVLEYTPIQNILDKKLNKAMLNLNLSNKLQPPLKNSPSRREKSHLSPLKKLIS